LLGSINVHIEDIDDIDAITVRANIGSKYGVIIAENEETSTSTKITDLTATDIQHAAAIPSMIG
jgi:hypothetical protein